MDAPPRHERLAAMRRMLASIGLDGFLLPLTDAYQGEYSAPSDRRVTWLTGFDGSAGAVLVLSERAVLFVDGRYTLQAAQQVDAADYEIVNSGETTPAEYLRGHVRSGAAIGYDPWLYTPSQLERMRAALGGHAALTPLDENPVDALWADRPAAPMGRIVAQPLEWAGAQMRDKLDRFAAELQKEDTEGFVVCLPENLCWLLNLRGADIPFNPLPHARAIVTAEGAVELFVDARKLDDSVITAFDDRVKLRPPESLAGALAEWRGRNIGIDPERTPAWIESRLKDAGATLRRLIDPVMLPKAIKNEAEILGMRRAHVIDGAAVTRFLCWYDTLPPDAEPTELEIVAKLERCRQISGDYRGPSFDTIAGVAGNGAVIHYRPTEATSRAARAGYILLLDSGAQYPFGTTDITRTLSRGEASPGFREAFTRVLKGHIALVQARFPEGTSGGQLDILARLPLWQAGMDYDHGTGHGVGCYLCVHEGPQRIAKRGGDVALAPGMILSNEPGYYKTGEYGIRIENLVLVADRGKAENGKRMLGFETLTLAPIDIRLLESKLLDTHERAWLNTYHARVIEQLSPLLDESERVWLIGHAAMT